jgi:hypothetical protein
MAEYIEGKIKLSSCDQKKAITGAGKDEKLEFIYKDGKIIVDKVPSVFGVRCGSSVAGYSQPGDLKSDAIHPVKWPKQKSKDQKSTLEDLVKYNGISKEDDTLVLDVPIRYHTAKLKVDTKHYGLPQTRNRMYLFVWQEEDGEDLGEYWKLLVEHMKSPVRHSLESFVLQEDHDIIRKFKQMPICASLRFCHVMAVLSDCCFLLIQAFSEKPFVVQPGVTPSVGHFWNLTFGHLPVPIFRTTKMLVLNLALQIWLVRSLTGDHSERSKCHHTIGSSF